MNEMRLMPDEYYAYVRRRTWIRLFAVPLVASVALVVLDFASSTVGGRYAAIIIVVVFGFLFVDNTRQWRRPVYISREGIRVREWGESSYQFIPRAKITHVEQVDRWCSGTSIFEKNGFDGPPDASAAVIRAGADDLIVWEYNLHPWGEIALNRASEVLDIPVTRRKEWMLCGG